jgi:hypothetical protein
MRGNLDANAAIIVVPSSNLLLRLLIICADLVKSDLVNADLVADDRVGKAQPCGPTGREGHNGRP